MKFIVDECVGSAVSRWLFEKGYDVFSVSDNISGFSDIVVLNKAFLENRILITNDKDFGEMVFRNNFQHAGIILLRLLDERPKNKILVIQQILDNYFDDLPDNYIVATEQTIRIIRRSIIKN